MASDHEPFEDFLSNELDALAPKISQVRGVLLEGLQKRERAMLAAAQNEELRLAAKYGSGSPPVLEARQRAVLHDAIAARVELEAQRASVVEREPSPDEAVVHGRILNPSGKQMEGVRVAAVRDDGRVIGESRTDATGYYRIAMRTGGAPTHFALQVQDRAGNTLYRDARPQSLELRRARYREMVIQAED